MCTVHDPATLVPQKRCDRRSEQQSDSAEPGVCRQTVVGVSKIPDIINDDVNPDHVGPDHILFILGRVNCPPAGHTEDVDNTCDAVEHIVPAAVQPYILAGEPPLIPAFECRFKIAGNGDQDIDGNDDEGISLEPVGFADAPAVFDHHETDTACKCRIKLCVVKPAVHIQISLV